MVAVLLLSYRCLVTVNVLWLFLMVPWVGLQCVIVVFPDYTDLLFVFGISISTQIVSILESSYLCLLLYLIEFLK